MLPSFETPLRCLSNEWHNICFILNKQNRAPYKKGDRNNLAPFFALKYNVTPRLNRLGETVFMRGHNMFLLGSKKKNI